MLSLKILPTIVSWCLFDSRMQHLWVFAITLTIAIAWLYIYFWINKAALRTLLTDQLTLVEKTQMWVNSKLLSFVHQKHWCIYSTLRLWCVSLYMLPFYRRFSSFQWPLESVSIDYERVEHWMKIILYLKFSICCFFFIHESLSRALWLYPDVSLNTENYSRHLAQYHNLYIAWLWE